MFLAFCTPPILSSAFFLLPTSANSILRPQLLRQREAGKCNLCSCKTVELNVQSATICSMTVAMPPRFAHSHSDTPSDTVSWSHDQSRWKAVEMELEIQVDVKMQKAVLLQHSEQT